MHTNTQRFAKKPAKKRYARLIRFRAFLLQHCSWGLTRIWLFFSHKATSTDYFVRTSVRMYVIKVSSVAPLEAFSFNSKILKAWKNCILKSTRDKSEWSGGGKKTKVSFKVYCPEEKFSEKAQIKISENASHDTSLTVWPLDGRTDERKNGGKEAGYRGMGSNLHGLQQTTWNCNKGFIEHRCVHQMTILKFMQMQG